MSGQEDAAQMGADVMTNISDDDTQTPSDHEFRLLADNIPTLCWVARADGHIHWYNRRWHDYCGSTPATMAGWGWTAMHDPALLPAVRERWLASIASGDRFEMTFPLRGADGTYRPFLSRAEPMRNAEGRVQRWFGVNFDISAQVDAQVQLSAANARLDALAAQQEAILSQLGEGVIATDTQGRITFVNEAANRLHGMTTLLVGPEGYTNAYSLLTETGEPHPIDALPLARAVREQETVVDSRWRIRRPGGSEVLVIGNARPVLDASGSQIGAVLTMRDDTKRHAEEAALAAAVRIKDVMLFEVNHRVKNSLQIVASLLMLQARRADEPKLKQALLEARSRIGVVASVHHRLYVSSDHAEVDLATYLRELTSDTIGALNCGDRIALHFHADGTAVIGLDRAVPVALIVSELLTNSIKYAFSGNRSGTITLSIGSTAAEISVTVADDGDGLPVGFDPATSTGLGMRIVTALVAQVLGRLEVSRQNAGGTAFVIVLPRDV